MIGGIELMAERTFSKDFREKLAGKGEALSDGSYPIPDKGALRRAIQAIGRAGPKGSDAYEKVKKHCIKRAKELDAMDLIPDEWLEHSEIKETLVMGMTIDQIGELLESRGATDEEIDAHLAHYGVQGMKWGVRRAQKLNTAARRGTESFGNRNIESTQRRVDRVRKIANGKATAGDILKGVAFNIPLADIIAEGGSVKGAAARQLDRAGKLQRKVVLGKKKTSDILMRLGGSDIRRLDYSYKSDEGNIINKRPDLRNTNP